MAKVLELEKDFWIYQCPGCEESHFFQTTGVPAWQFNNDVEKPTVTPSIRVRGGEGGNDAVCHFFIKDGMLEFCQDSTHKLSGETIEMIDWNN